MSSDLGQSWGSEVRLTDTLNWSRRPSLTCDGNGNYLHLFWFDLRDDPRNIVGEIYYKRKDLLWGISEAGQVSVSSKIKVEVYPNPFSQEIRIRYMMQDARYKIKDISIRIFDISGKEVVYKSMKDDISGVKINTKDLPCGVYFVEVRADAGLMVKKVIKIK
jgi:hypothetical protein